MIYKGETIGVLSLCNKRDEIFTKTDVTLLSTTIEIVTIAITNSKLHRQTLNLMQEREQLHRQAIQAERLATVGRLTATLSHEINNPMQAIRGALTLALEELDNPAELKIYIDLCLGESERVVGLINRLRQIYRPLTDKQEAVNLNNLLQEALDIAHKELNRQRVSLYVDLADDLPLVKGIANQLHLVFLNTMLNLAQVIGKSKAGELVIRSYSENKAVYVEFSTVAQIVTDSDWSTMFQKDALQATTDIGFGLSFSKDIISAHGGDVGFEKRNKLTVFSVKLPHA
jgi:nitrogen-specific signal transduction histidine kinase